MVTVGIVVALPCVWALGRLIESQLYDHQAGRSGIDRHGHLDFVLGDVGRSAQPQWSVKNPD